MLEEVCGPEVAPHRHQVATTSRTRGLLLRSPRVAQRAQGLTTEHEPPSFAHSESLFQTDESLLLCYQTKRREVGGALIRWRLEKGSLFFALVAQQSFWPSLMTCMPASQPARMARREDQGRHIPEPSRASDQPDEIILCDQIGACALAFLLLRPDFVGRPARTAYTGKVRSASCALGARVYCRPPAAAVYCCCSVTFWPSRSLAASCRCSCSCSRCRRHLAVICKARVPL